MVKGDVITVVKGDWGRPRLAPGGTDEQPRAGPGRPDRAGQNRSCGEDGGAGPVGWGLSGVGVGAGRRRRRRQEGPGGGDGAGDVAGGGGVGAVGGGGRRGWVGRADGRLDAGFLRRV